MSFLLRNSCGRFAPAAFSALVFAATVLVPTRAHADMCEDSCDSDAPPCSVEERCPESGVECYDEGAGSGYEECRAKAKADGLELRCTKESEIYCDPGEEVYIEDEGCALKSPKRPARGVGVAAITFAAAAAMVLVRARRRAKAGRDAR